MAMTTTVRILLLQLFLLLSPSLLPPVQSFLFPATCHSRGCSVPRRIAHTQQLSITTTTTSQSAMVSDEDTNENRKDTFSFAQRIESTKSGMVGLFAGGIALAPISAVHNLLFAYDGPLRTVTHNLAQFEFDADAGSVEAALFAIVYRYCLRIGDDDNPQLNQGVIAAFAVTRTLSKIQVPGYCSAVPLNCTCFCLALLLLVVLVVYVCVCAHMTNAEMMALCCAMTRFHSRNTLILPNANYQYPSSFWCCAGGSPLGYLDWAMIGQGALSGFESLALFGATAASMDYCFRRRWISKCP